MEKYRTQKGEKIELFLIHFTEKELLELLKNLDTIENWENDVLQNGLMELHKVYYDKYKKHYKEGLKKWGTK